MKLLIFLFLNKACLHLMQQEPCHSAIEIQGNHSMNFIFYFFNFRIDAEENSRSIMWNLEPVLNELKDKEKVELLESFREFSIAISESLKKIKYLYELQSSNSHLRFV